MTIPDLSGRFNPELRLHHLSRPALAVLGREWMLNGHLQDRVGLPTVMGRAGHDVMGEIAIEEWMAASPTYSPRMQRALNFVGNDVSTIFKNLQLDIGFAHQFMDVRYRLDSPTYGEFWLARCGALMDVEPFGEGFVRKMCHDIEDPTFDATAAVAHPCAKVRPIHRPPRTPADRLPHCHWKVFIDEESVPYGEHPNAQIVRRSMIAGTTTEVPAADAEPGGWPDYSRAFEPDFVLEDLSHRALLRAIQEFAVQSHLLARSFLLCVGQRFGEEAVREFALKQWTGIAGLTAERVKRAMRIEGDGAEAIAKVFQIHPAFHPRPYVDLRVEVNRADSLRLTIGKCPALEEGDLYSWFAHLDADPHPALAAIVRAVNPRARCRSEGGRQSWSVEIDPNEEPLRESAEVKLAKVSTGASIVFEQPTRS
jgi:hypothetical protein